LNIAGRAAPDLILLDIIMPGIDGFETCRRLKSDKTTQDIPVIFITAKDETEDIVEGFRISGVDYIIKPFEKEEILARVETHLKNARLTKALQQKNTELTEAIEKLQQEMDRREQAEAARNQAEADLKTADERLSLISEQEAQRWGIAGFVGQSKTIGKILTNIRQLQTTGTTSVLIQGESGTGKELIARAIHFGGPNLMAYPFPGNVRELKNIIERALIESGGEKIQPEHLHFVNRLDETSSPAVMDMKMAAAGQLPLNFEEAEALLIQRALAQTDGNISEAARLLGINRSRIYRKIAKETLRDA